MVSTSVPGHGRSRRARAAIWLALGVAAGCASAPSETRSQLDEQTGATVSSMRAPLEFYSPQPEKGLEATTFAYLGAFEVNVQGERQTYLWLGLLPGAERHSAAPPAGATAAPNLRILIDGETLEPVPAGNRSALGVSIRPFKPPARWTQEYYFNVGLPELEKLAAAQSLLLELGPQGASPQRFEPWQDKSAELKRFVAELRGATP